MNSPLSSVRPNKRFRRLNFKSAQQKMSTFCHAAMNWYEFHIYRIGRLIFSSLAIKNWSGNWIQKQHFGSITVTKTEHTYRILIQLVGAKLQTSSSLLFLLPSTAMAMATDDCVWWFVLVGRRYLYLIWSSKRQTLRQVLEMEYILGILYVRVVCYVTCLFSGNRHWKEMLVLEVGIVGSD